MSRSAILLIVKRPKSLIRIARSEITYCMMYRQEYRLLNMITVHAAITAMITKIRIRVIPQYCLLISITTTRGWRIHRGLCDVCDCGMMWCRGGACPAHEGRSPSADGRPYDDRTHARQRHVCATRANTQSARCAKAGAVCDRSALEPDSTSSPTPRADSWRGRLPCGCRQSARCGRNPWRSVARPQSPG